MILDVVGVALSVVGTLFVVVAGVGMLRFPDPLMRLHASTKAGTLGVAFIVSGMMCFYPSLSIATRGTALIVFLLLTAPVAAHMIGRASYYGGTSMNVTLWEGTIVDQMKEALGPGEGGAPSAG
ncbi:MAG: monovalent cation/H(+) antiporter subunit G [Salinibacter sp.]